jgi:hypothetical protein
MAHIPNLAGLSVNIGVPRCDFPEGADQNTIPFNLPQDFDDGTLRAQRVKGDGSCFFHSLAYLLPHPSIPAEDGTVSTWADSDMNGFQIRNLVVDYIKNDPEWYSKPGQIDNDLRYPGESDKAFVDRYTRVMYNTDVFAGQTEAEAASELLNAHIVIIEYGRYENFTRRGPDGGEVVVTRLVEENIELSKVRSRAWPCVRNPDGQTYRALTAEEAKSIPTYVLLYHHPQRPDGSFGAPHYSPVQLAEHEVLTKPFAKPEDIDPIKKKKKKKGERSDLTAEERFNQQRAEGGLYPELLDMILQQQYAMLQSDDTCGKPVKKEEAAELLRIVLENEKNMAPSSPREGGSASKRVKK